MNLETFADALVQHCEARPGIWITAYVLEQWAAPHKVRWHELEPILGVLVQQGRLERGTGSSGAVWRVPRATHSDEVPALEEPPPDTAPSGKVVQRTPEADELRKVWVLRRLQELADEQQALRVELAQLDAVALQRLEAQQQVTTALDRRSAGVRKAAKARTDAADAKMLEALGDKERSFKDWMKRADVGYSAAWRRSRSLVERAGQLLADIRHEVTGGAEYRATPLLSLVKDKVRMLLKSGQQAT